MKIIRRNEYISVPVRPLRSGALSIRAKGMLMVLFSLPEGRGMTDYDLVSACRKTLEDVSEVARELERAGYLVREGGALRVFEAPLDDGELEYLWERRINAAYCAASSRNSAAPDSEAGSLFRW